MKIAWLMGCLILLTAALPASAQVKPRRETPPKVENALARCGTDDFPDLIVKSVEIRKSDEMLITVENTGPCKAEKSSLKVDWAGTEAEVKEKAKKQPTDSHWLWVGVPALARGETKLIKDYWSGVYGKYAESKQFFAFTIDYEKTVREEDEYNNTFILSPGP